MRIVKPRSYAMIICIMTSIFLFILKIFEVGMVAHLSWWLIMLPLLLVIAGIVIYVVIYAGKILYRRKKYQWQQDNSGRK